MTVLLFNQRVDLDDPGQGVAIDWMHGLAARVDRLVVVTHHAGRVPRLENGVIHSLGREHGWTEARRALRFYRLVSQILPTERPTFCLSHMVPVSTVMAGPLLKARRIPILQWYTHRVTPWEIRVATRFATHVLTAASDSFGIETRKLIVTGHGIPTDRFTPGQARADEGTPQLLTVGRLAPIKHLEIMLQAVALLRDRGVPVRLRIVGGARVDSDRAYEAELRETARALRLESAIEFSGAVPRAELVDVYRDADIFVHACDSGLDKAGLEAMSCGIPLVSSSSGFAGLLAASGSELTVAHGSAAALATRVQQLLALSPVERRALGLKLREIVREQHDLSRLMDRIIALGSAAA